MLKVSPSPSHLSRQLARTALLAAALLALACLGSGCASSNVNPSKPRARTGYVDLYAADDPDLWWRVDEIANAGADTNRLFDSYDPLPDGILRLALPPGHHQLRIAYLNRALSGPGLADVDIQDGMVTPLSIALAEAGKAVVRTRSTTSGPTPTGRFRRAVKLNDSNSAVYDVHLEPQPAVPYQPKDKMTYAAEAKP